MRILVLERHITMQQLAAEFGVTDRTIRSDVAVLTVDYPLKTVRGNGGCVKLADWYHPHRNILSRRHQAALMRQIDKAEEADKKDLREILVSLGSPAVIQQIKGKGLLM
jgi:DeoR/GlpR family transcriptional regulator of sugar metabolism